MNLTSIIKRAAAFMSLILMLSLPTPVLGAVNPLEQACKESSGATLCKDNSVQQSHENNSIYGPNGIITKATGIISMLVGVAAIIVLIVAGLRYALASGDPANVSKARNTITYALIGMAVAAAAQGIVIFVLNKL